MLKIKSPFVMMFLVAIGLVISWGSPSSDARYTFTSPIIATPSVLPTPTPSISDEAQIALHYVSQMYNLSRDKLYVGKGVISEYPLTGKTLWQAKVGDDQGHTYLIAVDPGSKQIVDGEAIKSAEQEAYLQKYGKIEPELYDRLQAMDDRETIRVGIWLAAVNVEQIRSEVIGHHPDVKLEGFRPGKGSDLEQYEKIYAEMKEAEKRAYQERELPVITLLERQGFQVSFTSQYAPLIYVELPKGVILEMTKRDDVETIYLDKKNEPWLGSTIFTDRVAPVWNRGITGTGVQVAVVDATGIYFSHGDLADGSYFNSAQPNVGDHATMIAGVIASTNTNIRGVAYGVPALYSANAGTYTDTNLIAATEGAINVDARVLNHSYGNPTAGGIDGIARYHDYVAFYDWRTMVVAAGNWRNYTVSSPALAYNAIPVNEFSLNL